MGLSRRSRRLGSHSAVPFFIAVLVIGATIHVRGFVHANQTSTPGTRDLKLGTARAGTLYAVSVGVKDPVQLQGNESVHVTVNDAKGEIESKWLHAADLDFYLTIQPRADGPVTASLSSSFAGRESPEISARLKSILQTSALPGYKGDHRARGVIAASPNGTWQDAQPFELGQTIFGSDDERPYAPSGSEDGYEAMLKGFHWFRFTFREKQPKLIYFVLNVIDRDVPLDVDIFQMGKDATGKPDVVPYVTGEFV